MPHWLLILSWVSIILGAVTAGMIALEVSAHPQKMRIMNIVWPVTGLYFPLIGIWFYRAMGRPWQLTRQFRRAKHPIGNGYSSRQLIVGVVA